MKKRSSFWLAVFTALLLLTAGLGEAYAARMGGGKSFGSRPSYSMPFSRPGYTQAAPASQPSYAPSAAAAQNAAARSAMGNRGGLMGMLGGLALGGMLGAMFFGGAFEGINFLDLLLFAGIAFLLLKLFAARRQEGAGPVASYGGAYRQAHDTDAYQRQGPGFNTDVLSGRTGSGNASGFSSARSPLPPGFDAPEFLQRAKTAYAYLQQAWDRGDLPELRGLCGDAVFAELQQQIRQRQGESHTELLKVDAELLEAKAVGGDLEAAVLFKVLMREEPGQSPSMVQEVWHFSRPQNSRTPTWLLEGIQQVDD